MSAASVLLVLTLWGCVAIALVRRAESAVAPPPAPWFSLGIAFALAVTATFCRSGVDATRCGVACIALAVAAGADARTGLLFDAVTLPAACAVALLALAGGTAGDAAVGVVALVGTFGALVLASRGRWMGLGDVKAMYAVGAAFGPLESLVAVFVACLCAIAAASWQRRLARGSEIRFGPHLAAGSAFALVAGHPFVHRVMGL